MTPGIREQYRRDLFDDFLPFMDRFVIDHDLGGFLCTADRDGTRLAEDKDSWYEGRGIWIYSYLYRHFTHDPRHLEIARKAKDFILSIRPADRPLWPRKFTRTGEITQADGEVYGSLFIAEGLVEFAAASGEAQHWDLAKEIALSCIEVSGRPDYPVDTRHYIGPDAPPFPGARVQGVPMVLLRLATQMLAQRPDRALEQAAAGAVEALMHRHYDSTFDLNLEFLNHDYSHPSNDYAQFSCPGHTLEAMWMVMDEALRRKDSALFDLAAERFRRNVEVAWDDVYGGLFSTLVHIDRNQWITGKYLWVQEEALVGALMLVEHRNDPWARTWFEKVHNHVRARYPLARYRLPLWITFADRKVTFERHFNRIENYHHPRHLMLNLEALTRILS